MRLWLTRLSIASVLLWLALWSGCKGGDGGGAGECGANGGAGGITGTQCPINVTLAGTGFSAFEGLTVFVVVLQANDNAVEDYYQQTIQNGGFAFSFPDDTAEGVEYNLDFFIDVNGDNSCDAPPTDAVFRVVVPASQTDQAINVAYDPTSEQAAGCVGFE